MTTTVEQPFVNSFALDIIPSNETARLEALKRYRLLETPPEASFQNIVELVASYFKVPIALISLVDEKEVVFKSGTGMGNVQRASRGVSLCSLAILSDDPTIIDQPLQEPCLLANPLVHGKFGLRFYAAAPLTTPDGYNIGALCIVDKVDRTFSPEQEADLVKFSKIIMHEIEVRYAVQQKEEALKYEVKQRHRIITNAVIQAQEEVRTHIGLELHDNVSQTLTTVKLYNEMAVDDLANSKSILLRSTAYLQECIDNIRFLSKQLSAPTLGDISLKDSILDLVNSLTYSNSSNRIKIEVAYDADEAAISKAFHLCVYRIVQAQLHNILKHSGASVALISFKHSIRGFELIIEDNGRGFDISVRKGGIGLINMQTRADQFDGKLSVHTAPGKGCKLSVRFPLLNGQP